MTGHQTMFNEITDRCFPSWHTSTKPKFVKNHTFYRISVELISRDLLLYGCQMLSC
jgi:hypothetical protein